MTCMKWNTKKISLRTRKRLRRLMRLRRKRRESPKFREIMKKKSTQRSLPSKLKDRLLDFHN